MIDNFLITMYTPGKMGRPADLAMAGSILFALASYGLFYGRTTARTASADMTTTPENTKPPPPAEADGGCRSWPAGVTVAAMGAGTVLRLDDRRPMALGANPSSVRAEIV